MVSISKSKLCLISTIVGLLFFIGALLSIKTGPKSEEETNDNSNQLNSKISTASTICLIFGIVLFFGGALPGVTLYWFNGKTTNSSNNECGSTVCTYVPKPN